MRTMLKQVKDAIEASNPRRASFCVSLLMLLSVALLPGSGYCADLAGRGLLLEIGGHALVFPVMAPRLSSKFGKRKHPIARVTRHHSGVDLAAPRSSQIRAVADGTVVFSDTFSHYGKLVVIQHADGVTSHYGHCDQLLASPGELIKAGQIIATVGSTGLSTGPHLHFEIRRNGEPLNPEILLPALHSRADG